VLSPSRNTDYSGSSVRQVSPSLPPLEFKMDRALPPTIPSINKRKTNIDSSDSEPSLSSSSFDSDFDYSSDSSEEHHRKRHCRFLRADLRAKEKKKE
jgi:hypothetical protein